MEDLRWACQAVNLRQVRSSLAMAKPRMCEPNAKRARLDSGGGAAAASPRTLDISEPDPLGQYSSRFPRTTA